MTHRLVMLCHRDCVWNPGRRIEFYRDQARAKGSFAGLQIVGVAENSLRLSRLKHLPAHPFAAAPAR